MNRCTALKSQLMFPIVCIFAMEYLNALLSTLTLRIELKNLKHYILGCSQKSVMMFHVKWSPN